MAPSMADMGVKFCTASDCSQGGSRPALIWSDVARFNIMRKCTVCGLDLLQKLPSTINPVTGVKRGIDSGDNEEENMEGARKRPRSATISIQSRQDSTASYPLREIPKTTSSNSSQHSNSDERPVAGPPGTITALLKNLVRASPLRSIESRERVRTNASRQTESPPVIRELRWCLECNCSVHNTLECGNAGDFQKDILTAELHWQRFKRKLDIFNLCQTPQSVLTLMDHLTLHQFRLSDIEGFLVKRDNALRELLQDRAFLDRLNPILSTNETSRTVFETQIVVANNSTRIFLLSAVQVVFQVFWSIVIRSRKKEDVETSGQYRMRLTEEVYQYPWQFPISEVVLQNFAASLEDAWFGYVRGMKDLESMYLSKHYGGRDLDDATNMILRLPTSYLRIRSVKHINGKALWVRNFHMPAVHSNVKLLPEYLNIMQQASEVFDTLEEGERTSDIVIKQEDPA